MPVSTATVFSCLSLSVHNAFETHYRKKVKDHQLLTRLALASKLIGCAGMNANASHLCEDSVLSIRNYLTS